MNRWLSFAAIEKPSSAKVSRTSKLLVRPIAEGFHPITAAFSIRDRVMSITRKGGPIGASMNLPMDHRGVEQVRIDTTQPSPTRASRDAVI
jgi:hypothetical protein